MPEATTIFGKRGDDLLDGDQGTDALWGGPEADICLNGESHSQCEQLALPDLELVGPLRLLVSVRSSSPRHTRRDRSSLTSAVTAAGDVWGDRLTVRPPIPAYRRRCVLASGGPTLSSDIGHPDIRHLR